MDRAQNDRKFPRQVVISRGYGAGLASWWSGSTLDPYGLVESPILIDACKTQKSWDDVTALLIEAGYDEDAVMDLYGGGWPEADVAWVSGPYRVNEYDGAESIEERDSVEWRD